MVFTAMIIFSFIGFQQLPVSLLPHIEVPSILVKVNYPNGAPEEIEKNVLKLIRQNLITLNGIKSIESKASSQTGMIELTFEYGTNMSLAYIETNEKIDRLTEYLPRSLDRPQVIKVNTSDIPILRVQAIPKTSERYLEISELVVKVLKKRLEQIEGVSLVDVNGKREAVISIIPDQLKLQSYGITPQLLSQTISANNRQLGGVSVRDGYYRYYVKIKNDIGSIDDIRSLYIKSPEGKSIRLAHVAEIQYDTKEIQGYHTYNGKEGLVINVHKQHNAQMNALIPQIEESVSQFSREYSTVDFYLTQDQSALLNAGIDNLKTSLMYGGVFAFLVLFLFMSDIRLPVIIGISLPVSLIVSFLFFYLTGISINIISLSGLALGLGMLIDNAIIVLDNITSKRENGATLIDACVDGVQEVMGPLISSVLTTLSVFIPLVFLSGISGALFFNQAVAVTIILSVSLLVAFILLPLIYKLIYAKSTKVDKSESFLYTKLLWVYKAVFNWCFSYKKTSILLLMLMIPIGIFIFKELDKEGLPVIHKKDALLNISWNEAISVSENKERINNLTTQYRDQFEVRESDIGLTQYLLSKEGSQLTKASVYLLFKEEVNHYESLLKIEKLLSLQFPKAEISITKAPNAFDQIFSNNQPELEVRVRDRKIQQPIEKESLISLSDNVREYGYKMGKGIALETTVLLEIDHQKLTLYDIDYNLLKTTIEQLFGDNTITEIKRFGEITPIQLKEEKLNFELKISKATISNQEGVNYPLNQLLTYKYGEDFKEIYADKVGIYQSFQKTNGSSKETIDSISEILAGSNLNFTFDGKIFDNIKSMKELMTVLLISVLLLYFILAAQFESFIQPLIVILTLPLGITGSVLLLKMTGTTLNIMSSIGIVVMLGIIVNDSILKIDTINRLRARREDLINAISKAGEKRLKPILMTSITTILALVPILFSSGIGADLQKPLVYAVIGGLTIGTIASIYFIPLMYALMYQRAKQPNL